MSTLSPPADVFHSERGEAPVYRTLSRAALLSPILGLLALPGLMFPSLLVIAFTGMVLALIGLSSIRRYPDEYSGRGLAYTGLAFCGLLGFGGTAAHIVEYMTEVPEGYERISFVELNPDDPKAPALPPATAAALDGKQVFIKGYVYPDGQGEDIKQFVMIPDLKTCCFGGQPKMTDMVLVTLRDPHRTVYNQRKRKLTGILKVDKSLRPVDGVTGVFYELDAESIK